MEWTGNWVDLVIFAVLAWGAYGGFQAGLLSMLISVGSFVSSLLLSFRLYPPVAKLLQTQFSLSTSLAKAVAFLLVAAVSEAILSRIVVSLIEKIPTRFIKHWWNKPLGMIVGIAQAGLILSFVTTLIVLFPVQASLKRDVSESRFGSFFLEHTQQIEKHVQAIFGDVVESTITYLSVKNNSTERVDLDSEVTTLTVDEASEADLVRRVNDERVKAGVSPLSVRRELIPVARAHAKDMWERKYFAHTSPDGLDVGDRLQAANVSYLLAGENLALAPTVAIAHTGLMNSEGHRKNILEPAFSQIGIGVIDNGMYGKMFVQVFTD